MMRDVVFQIWDYTERVIGVASNALGTGHFILSAVHDEGERTLSMTLDATDEKAGLFETGCYVGFYDADERYQLFEIKDADITASDGSTLEVYAEHIRYELAHEPIRDIRPTDTSINHAVEQGLVATRWRVGDRADAGQASARGYYTDVLTYLTEIAKIWDVEYDFEVVVQENRIVSRLVHIRQRLGEYRGRRFEYAKDTQTVKGHLSTSGLYTALIGRGRGEEVGETEGGDATFGRRIRFDTVSWKTANGDPVDKPLGRDYVEDPDATARFGFAGGTRPRVGFVVFDQIDDPLELLQATWDYLQTVNRPTASYKLSVLDLEPFEGPREAVRMGDWVLVIHRAVNPAIQLQARVIRIKRDLLSPEATVIELGDARSTLSERVNTINRVIEKVQGINDNGTFPTTHLQGAIDALKNQLVASGAYQDAEVLQDQGILLENTDAASSAYGAMYLGPGLFAIAGGKQGDEWNWRTFGTGKGFVADEMITGTLRAEMVTILGTDNFYWDAGNIVFIDPDNALRRIHLGCYDGVHYGFALSIDGGETWQSAMDFDGLQIASTSIIQDMQARLSQAEFAVRPDQIVSTVRTSDAYQGDLATKSTTYFGATQPIAPVKGDIWIDSSDNNLMKRYSGTAWEPVQDGEISALVQNTGGIVAAIGNNRLSFDRYGLKIMNAQGVTVFKQDNTTGALDITGILRAIGGEIGPLSISSTALKYGSQLSIEVSGGSARIQLGNLLLRYVNSGTQYGFIYGPEEGPYFAVSDQEAYFGRAVKVTPSAMPTQLQGTLMTYNRSTGTVGSGYKIAHGTVNINDSSAAYIYFADAGFTQPPNIVATYSKTGANDSGARGAIKVYNKTATSANLIIAGSYPQYMDVDWIAIGS